MTVTIDLTPAEEARLTADAAQAGLDVSSLAKRRILADSLHSGEALNEEFHDLVDLELAGQLTEAQSVRLREIERQMDEADAHDPLEQEMDRRVRETSSQLDAILALLKNLPQTKTKALP